MARRRAQAARGKAGVSAAGMTPAQAARAGNPELSGRELAQALREQRSRRGGAGQKKSAPTGRQRPARTNASQAAAQDAPWKVGASETADGQTVTGTMVGRSRDVTGDEASTCRTVTGTEYMGADIFRDFCQAEPAKGFNRVGVSSTGRGNRVTGNEVGRSGKVTGDEPGTCKQVTGTEYVGAGQ
ncbi:MAG: CsoS2 family carboxysome shell protein, partial [Gammaproteobacteria bacterium]